MKLCFDCAVDWSPAEVAASAKYSASLILLSSAKLTPLRKLGKNVMSILESIFEFIQSLEIETLKFANDILLKLFKNDIFERI